MKWQIQGGLSKIVKHATQQIEKSVVRATAKLKTLLQNIEDLKSYNIQTQKLILVDDRTVEKQVLFNQIDQIRKSMDHRENLDILPINFIACYENFNQK